MPSATPAPQASDYRVSYGIPFGLKQRRIDLPALVSKECEVVVKAVIPHFAERMKALVASEEPIFPILDSDGKRTDRKRDTRLVRFYGVCDISSYCSCATEMDDRTITLHNFPNQQASFYSVFSLQYRNDDDPDDYEALRVNGTLEVSADKYLTTESDLDLRAELDRPVNLSVMPGVLLRDGSEPVTCLGLAIDPHKSEFFQGGGGIRMSVHEMWNDTTCRQVLIDTFNLLLFPKFQINSHAQAFFVPGEPDTILDFDNGALDASRFSMSMFIHQGFGAIPIEARPF